MIEAKKNSAYYLSFPAIDSATPASYKSGISPVDTAYYKDGAGAWSSLAITDTATEIGATGVYEIDLTASEMNHDKVIIKFAVSGMADDAYQFDMRTKLTDDLNDAITAPTAVENRTEMDSNSTQLTSIVEDTNELQTDDVPGLIATAQSDLDKLTGADGATLATTQGNYEPATAASLATTDGKIDTINTNAARLTAARAQAIDDWINGGRLDLILDIIAADVVNLDGDAMRGTDSAYTGTPPTAAAIVNEWESQSQTDPTGFHVNVLEVGGTGQTANDNGADINTLVTRVTAAVATEAKQDIIDTVVDAIKTQTDQFVFTTANKVDSRVDYVGANAVTTPDDFKADVSALATAAALTAVDTVVDAIKAVTDNLPNSGALTDLATAAALTIVDTVVDRIEVDTQDIQSRIPAALASGRMSSDSEAISGSTDAADKLEASTETMVIGTVSHDNTAAITNIFYSDDVVEATADHFNGRKVIFTSGAVIRQATSIEDYELESGEGKFTVVALTEAPADNVTFIIV